MEKMLDAEIFYPCKQFNLIKKNQSSLDDSFKGKRNVTDTEPTASLLDKL